MWIQPSPPATTAPHTSMSAWGSVHPRHPPGPPMTARLPLERHRMLDRVMATLDALSPSEKRVGQLLIDNPRRFAAMSMSEIASECCVSKPTIVRFCKGWATVDWLRSGKNSGATPRAVCPMSIPR
ncbi:MurR/RpiR family transcriptional regulator [Verminephrobacter eiseniae]|nr:MurR/RpiR family transcriptional regulator [Verminephrobacter eiseniae]MCW5293789.1 MurR/RpiR family transcriptional regulator [Verminephrobacter eiseniae]MCW8185993.1 MurR/RpiR family transcriptional regulator [Verminephrobacter eiseniae]MCW8221914.1 MurR/RpiR family transcriptional regulator [Verminephrobacter eiseniae]MCW8235752.1 MurR/RpiR family transcriptional regulator [Verminephrobacter eiseniae]